MPFLRVSPRSLACFRTTKRERCVGEHLNPPAATRDAEFVVSEEGSRRLIYEYQVRAKNGDHLKVWVHFIEGKTVEVYVKNKGLLGIDDDGVYGVSRSHSEKWGFENLAGLL